MTAITLDASGFRTPLDPEVLEKHLRSLRGVTSAASNFASATVTVDYDPAKTAPAQLEAAVRDCGFHCAGEAVPRHVCVPGKDTFWHAGEPPAGPPTKLAEHAVHDEMADMGHGPSMDIQAMARDMRNRFLVCLGFSIPIFFLAPMGLDFLRVPPPFGLPLKPLLFVLASGAIIYPRGGRSSPRLSARCAAASSTWRCWCC